MDNPIIVVHKTLLEQNFPFVYSTNVGGIQVFAKGTIVAMTKRKAKTRDCEGKMKTKK